MHRLFCTEISTPGSMAALEKREQEHLFKVFRAMPGEEVELLDGRGGRARAVVRPGKTVEILSFVQEVPPASPLHLCCALPRRQKLDALLKQAAELGAASIRPLRCIRSVADGDPSERWDLLLREACKQSGNAFLPEIFPLETPAGALERLRAENVTVFYGAVEAAPLPAGYPGAKAWFVGPEGGFAPEEETLLRESGARALHLAPHILRLETAAVCGLAVLRFLGICLAVLLLGCGCSRDLSRHPLMEKGKRYQREGNGELARKFYNRMTARFPDAPEPQLALASVCDELLKDTPGALYHYREYLRLAPDSPRRKTVEGYIRLLTQKLHEEFGMEQEKALLAENRAMKQQLEVLKKHIYWQQQKIQQLSREKNTGGERRRKK